MPRFVLLDHDWPRPHLDLMLDSGGALWTWRLEDVPALDVPIEAERLADHRVAYLDYEGPVSGGRGVVARRDGGEFDWVERGESRVVVRLRGRVVGLLILTHRQGQLWQAELQPG